MSADQKYGVSTTSTTREGVVTAPAPKKSTSPSTSSSSSTSSSTSRGKEDGKQRSKQTNSSSGSGEDKKGQLAAGSPAATNSSSPPSVSQQQQQQQGQHNDDGRNNVLFLRKAADFDEDDDDIVDEDPTTTKDFTSSTVEEGEEEEGSESSPKSGDRPRAKVAHNDIISSISLSKQKTNNLGDRLSQGRLSHNNNNNNTSKSKNIKNNNHRSVVSDDDDEGPVAYSSNRMDTNTMTSATTTGSSTSSDREERTEGGTYNNNNTNNNVLENFVENRIGDQPAAQQQQQQQQQQRLSPPPQLSTSPQKRVLYWDGDDADEDEENNNNSNAANGNGNDVTRRTSTLLLSADDDEHRPGGEEQSSSVFHVGGPHSSAPHGSRQLQQSTALEADDSFNNNNNTVNVNQSSSSKSPSPQAVLATATTATTTISISLSPTLDGHVQQHQDNAATISEQSPAAAANGPPLRSEAEHSNNNDNKDYKNVVLLTHLSNSHSPLGTSYHDGDFTVVTNPTATTAGDEEEKGGDGKKSITLVKEGSGSSNGGAPSANQHNISPSPHQQQQQPRRSHHTYHHVHVDGTSPSPVLSDPDSSRLIRPLRVHGDGSEESIEFDNEGNPIIPTDHYDDQQDYYDHNEHYDNYEHDGQYSAYDEHDDDHDHDDGHSGYDEREGKAGADINEEEEEVDASGEESGDNNSEEEDEFDHEDFDIQQGDLSPGATEAVNLVLNDLEDEEQALEEMIHRHALRIREQFQAAAEAAMNPADGTLSVEDEALLAEEFQIAQDELQHYEHEQRELLRVRREERLAVLRSEILRKTTSRRQKDRQNKKNKGKEGGRPAAEEEQPTARRLLVDDDEDDDEGHDHAVDGSRLAETPDVETICGSEEEERNPSSLNLKNKKTKKKKNQNPATLSLLTKKKVKAKSDSKGSFTTRREEAHLDFGPFREREGGNYGNEDTETDNAEDDEDEEEEDNCVVDGVKTTVLFRSIDAARYDFMTDVGRWTYESDKAHKAKLNATLKALLAPCQQQELATIQARHNFLSAKAALSASTNDGGTRGSRASSPGNSLLNSLNKKNTNNNIDTTHHNGSPSSATVKSPNGNFEVSSGVPNKDDGESADKKEQKEKELANVAELEARVKSCEVILTQREKRLSDMKEAIRLLTEPESIADLVEQREEKALNEQLQRMRAAYRSALDTAMVEMVKERLETHVSLSLSNSSAADTNVSGIIVEDTTSSTFAQCKTSLPILGGVGAISSSAHGNGTSTSPFSPPPLPATGHSSSNSLISATFLEQTQPRCICPLFPLGGGITSEQHRDLTGLYRYFAEKYTLHMSNQNDCYNHNHSNNNSKQQQQNSPSPSSPASSPNIGGGGGNSPSYQSLLLLSGGGGAEADEKELRPSPSPGSNYGHQRRSSTTASINNKNAAGAGVGAGPTANGDGEGDLFLTGADFFTTSANEGEKGTETMEKERGKSGAILSFQQQQQPPAATAPLFSLSVSDASPSSSAPPNPLAAPPALVGPIVSPLQVSLLMSSNSGGGGTTNKKEKSDTATATNCTTNTTNNSKSGVPAAAAAAKDNTLTSADPLLVATRETGSASPLSVQPEDRQSENKDISKRTKDSSAPFLGCSSATTPTAVTSPLSCRASAAKVMPFITKEHVVNRTLLDCEVAFMKINSQPSPLPAPSREVEGGHKRGGGGAASSLLGGSSKTSEAFARREVGKLATILSTDDNDAMENQKKEEGEGEPCTLFDQIHPLAPSSFSFSAEHTRLAKAFPNLPWPALPSTADDVFVLTTTSNNSQQQHHQLQQKNDLNIPYISHPLQSAGDVLPMSVSVQRRVIFDAATSKLKRKQAFKQQHKLAEWAALQRSRAEKKVDALVADVLAAHRRVEERIKQKLLLKQRGGLISKEENEKHHQREQGLEGSLNAATITTTTRSFSSSGRHNLAAGGGNPLLVEHTEKDDETEGTLHYPLPHVSSKSSQSKVGSPMILAAAEAASAIGYQQNLQLQLQLSPSKIALMRADSLTNTTNNAANISSVSTNATDGALLPLPTLNERNQTTTTTPAYPASSSVAGVGVPANNNTANSNNTSAAAAAATALSTFELQIRMDPYRTGFEEERELPIIPGTVIADRFQIVDLLGQATFSRAVRCVDLQQRYVYNSTTGEYTVKMLKSADAPLTHVDGTFEEDLHEDTDAEEEDTDDDQSTSADDRGETDCDDSDTDAANGDEDGHNNNNTSSNATTGEGALAAGRRDGDDDNNDDEAVGTPSGLHQQKGRRKSKKRPSAVAAGMISKENRKLFSMVVAASAGEGGGVAKGLCGLVDSDADDDADNNDKTMHHHHHRGNKNKRKKRKNSESEEGGKTRSVDTYVQVCLKIINNSKEFFDQSLDEIRLLHLLNSRGNPDTQHFVRMYHFFYHREHTFIVTELLSDNLYEYGKYIRDHRMPTYYTIPRLRSITKQILTALAFCHSMNLIHCDLKPENILFVSHSRCTIKVIDFGSSCFLSDHLSSYVQSRSYRAPEVILGADYDGRIDIWSLGAILVELVTQQVLFQSETAAEMLARIVAVCGKPLPRSLLYEGRATANFIDRFGCVYEVGEKGGDPGAEDCYYLYTPVHTMPLRIDKEALKNNRHGGGAVDHHDGQGDEEEVGGSRSSHDKPSGVKTSNSLAIPETISRTIGTQILASALSSSPQLSQQQTSNSNSTTKKKSRDNNEDDNQNLIIGGTKNRPLPMAKAFPVEPYSFLRSKLAAEGVDPYSLFADFVIQCLDLDHKRRPTSAELLNHPFLFEVDDEENEEQYGKGKTEHDASAAYDDHPDDSYFAACEEGEEHALEEEEHEEEGDHHEEEYYHYHHQYSGEEEEENEEEGDHHEDQRFFPNTTTNEAFTRDAYERASAHYYHNHNHDEDEEQEEDPYCHEEDEEEIEGGVAEEHEESAAEEEEVVDFHYDTHDYHDDHDAGADLEEEEEHPLAEEEEPYDGVDDSYRYQVTRHLDFTSTEDEEEEEGHGETTAEAFLRE